MTGMFFLITALFLSVLPVFNGYTYLSPAIIALTLMSSVRTLLIQWCVLLTWLAIANYFVKPVQGGFQTPDEFYLYMLHALFFVAGAPRSTSHIEQLPISKIRPFLILVRYFLLVLALGLATTALFRPYPTSNLIWAMVCYIYAHYLPRWESAISLSAILRHIALLSLLAIIAFSIIEIEVRLFLVAPPPPNDYYMPHPESIFTTCPNSCAPVYIKKNDGTMFSPLVTISSQGTRDIEFGKKKTDEFRIVLLGDSSTMGHGLEAEETIDSKLELLLQEINTGKNVQVINCGVGGYAPWQERIFLQERGFPLEPDIVVLQLFPANDVAGSYSKVKKYLRAIDPKWEYDLLNYYRYNQCLPSRVERKCKQYSSAYRLLLTLTNSHGMISPLLSKCRLLQPATLPRIVSQTNRTPTLEVCLKDWYPELDEAWSIYVDSIRGIRDDCQEKGVILIAYAHGDQMSICPPSDWDKLNECFPDTPYEMNKDIRLTNELLTELNIPAIDVLSVLKNYSIKDVYYIHNGHFTTKGAEIVAVCLRDYLLGHYFSEHLLMEKKKGHNRFSQDKHKNDQ